MQDHKPPVTDKHIRLAKMETEQDDDKVFDYICDDESVPPELRHAVARWAYTALSEELKFCFLQRFKPDYESLAMRMRDSELLPRSDPNA